MEVLSHADGSAQAIKQAASEGALDHSRRDLERELDRLNGGLAAHVDAMAQHLNWTLLAQAFLVTSYFIVLVGGWSVPLPGKRWLLSAIAGYGALSLVLGYLTVRGHRDRLGPLKQSRRLIEQALERVAKRPVVFSREGLLSCVAGVWASRLLPLLILLGWGALTLYTLAVPLPTDARAAAETRGEPRPAAVPAASRARATARKSEEPTAAVQPPPAAAESENGLAALFRRSITTPAPERGEQADSVKP